jgi:DNA-binding NarL/FixJ family response regulator
VAGLSKSVLLCNRDKLVADAVACVLTEHGHEVVVVETIDAIVERAAGAKACVVDMAMRDAAAGIRRITALPSPPRVLAFVTHESHLAAAIDAGADACVTSADGLDRLVHLLRTDIEISPRMSADLARRHLNRARVQAGGQTLTAREADVLAGLVRGESTKALAERLNVRPATARTHVQHLLGKLGVHSRLQAVAFVIEHPIDELVESAADEVSAAG